MNATKFSAGRTVMTPGAMACFTTERLLACLNRHLSGDWGDVCASDARANDRAVKDGDRIVSSYTFGNDALMVITEADRSSTCLLLPSEY